MLLEKIKTVLPDIKYDDNKQLKVALDEYVAKNPLNNTTAGKLAHMFHIKTDYAKLIHQVEVKTAKIKELQEKNYKVTRVFVTFEKEDDQRETVAMLKKARKIDSNSELLFRKTDALSVSEAEEPTSIRYQDLHVGAWTTFLQSTGTLLLTFGLIAITSYVLAIARNNKLSRFAGYLTKGFNSASPKILKALMMFEQHKSESSWQTSFYLRMTIFRWFNTSIVLRLINPFKNTIGNEPDDLLPIMSGIFVAELTISWVTSYLDIGGSLQKHVLAPRAKSQAQMNLAFKGTYYNLAERYTDFTNIVFLCFFFCALNPASFFICGAILLLKYYCDKFALMVRFYFILEFAFSYFHSR